MFRNTLWRRVNIFSEISSDNSLIAESACLCSSRALIWLFLEGLMFAWCGKNGVVYAHHVVDLERFVGLFFP